MEVYVMRSNYRQVLIVLAAAVLVAAVGMATVAGLKAEVPLPAPQTAKAQDRPLSSLRDLNQAFVDIAAMVKPAVVTVSTEKTLRAQAGSPFGSPFAGDPFFDMFFGPQGRGGGNQPREQEFRQQGLGSGVIVSADGRILTNNHVIDNVDSIFVRTFNGERYSAKLVGADPKTDVAVLQIDAKNLDYLKIGNSDSLQVGEIVLAVGSPLSESLAYTVTQGIVSAKGRSNVGLADYEDFIQTDAAINRGNSGGPLVNLDGELVGLNTAILSSSGGFQGIGMAVPSNMAVRVMESLISEGRVVRGWLGVSIQDLTPAIAKGLGLEQSGGAVVGEVVSDGPSKKAGLQAGDVIVSVDGQAIENSTQLRNRIAGTKPDTRVALKVLRGNDRLNVDVKLGELPNEPGAQGNKSDLEDRLGFSVATLDSKLARQYEIDRQLSGVVVTSLDQSSAAARAGLREGDLIRGVYRGPVETKEEFVTALEGTKAGEMVLLQVSRDGGGFYIAFNIG
jgi:serine protease Do